MPELNGKCFFCKEPCFCDRKPLESRTFYYCNVCGSYDISDYDKGTFEKNYFASYLFYENKIFSKIKDYNYFCYIGNLRNFEKIKSIYPLARLITREEVINWYPTNFTQKIDYILLGLAKLSEYEGKNIILPIQEIYSLFFIKRYSGLEELSLENRKEQLSFFTKYMLEQGLANINENDVIIVLPEGWKRIDELQKNQSSSKQAFIAMQFSEETKNLREAIRQGVKDAGYIPHFIDEKEHNNQIVPEILFEIKASKFVIAELSSHNNGAYYEAGYATGLGKEVIHICNKDIFLKEGHFDVKQKATILWRTESEIPDLLCKRIKATIY